MTTEALIAEADALLAEAEAKIPAATVEILPLLRRAVSSMLKAFLRANDLEIAGDIETLFQRCREIEPEFAAIAAEVSSLLGAAAVELESEIALDSANEVWDFITEAVSGRFGNRSQTNLTNKNIPKKRKFFGNSE